MHASAKMDELERWAIAEEHLSVFRHDLRNRVGSIRNANFYLQRRVEKTPLWGEETRVPKFFGLIDEQLQSAEKLITERATLLALVPRPQSVITWSDCLHHVLDQVAFPNTVTLETQLASVTGWDVCLDELAVAVRALVRNAYEALPGERGTLTVRSRDVGRASVLEIEDSGPGIPVEGAAAVFVPFSSTKPGHTGIGLNVARRILSRYHGTLTLKRGAAGGVLAEATLSPAPQTTPAS